MAISKLLNIRSAADRPYFRSLGRTITYILNSDKTDKGVLTGAVNCRVGSAYEQMVLTKEYYGKTDKRQGYHYIISFAPGETDAQTAMEIISSFVKEYLGDRYEAVYAVHENTEAIHGHVVFNSVSFFDGRKYHYDNGDWQKDIQPLVNRLCRSHGLSEIDPTVKGESRQLYRDVVRGAGRLGVFRPMIIRDLDAAVLLTADFEQFKRELTDRGYELKCGKHFAIRPPGMTRFCRTKSLGEEYSEGRLRDRIRRAKYNRMLQSSVNPAPSIHRYNAGRIRYRPLSPIQKRQVARMYRIGKLKKKTYSQAWKYKEEIKRLKQIQEQCQLLIRYNVRSTDDLISLRKKLDEDKRRVSTEKRRLYRDKELFARLSAEQGYSEKEIEDIRAQVETELKAVRSEDSRVRSECNALERVIRETISNAAGNRVTAEVKEIGKQRILERERKRKREYVRQHE